jgi:glycosyltransferase involved in cell wall biosynthesis
MNHLIISREYPPAPSGGGIGTYVNHMAELLADHGENVHVIGQMWPGAPRARETRHGGRLIVHRVAADEPLPDRPLRVADPAILNSLRLCAVSGFPWQAALLAESLIEAAGIDLVEVQEYEAPGYALMLRRTAGLGPARRVPILVHLHTPTEFLYKMNGWEQDLRDHATVIQLERAAIRAADALVCPSRFLARIAESHYELERGAVEVIPYPMGDTNLLVRDENTWRDGVISYAGRLEPRKGVTEWIDAATAAAQDLPARFTLLGGDTSSSGSSGESVRILLRRRIPPGLRSHFRFVNAVPRRKLLAHLAQARIAVVPSRWENFPYTCIEAMASGLPVLASPCGGMAEMIEDGRTGWIAEGPDARSLEMTLRRALATAPSVLAEMGAAAGASIRALCDNREIVRRQLELRRRVVATGYRRPAAIPLPLESVANNPGPEGHPGGSSVPVQGRTMTALGILRSSRHQQLAMLRRALTDPRYVARWLVWHGRRGISRVSRKPRSNFEA